MASAPMALSSEISKDFNKLEQEVMSLREAIKRRETISEMKQDKLVNLRRMVALHERMHRLTQDRIEELEGAEKAAQSNLDYKTTLFDTFSEGLTVKQATLGKLETAVHDQTKRYEILSTRKSVAQYCLEARERQIKLLSEHVAGALEDRSKQKDAMVQFHQARVEQQEKEYKVQGNQEKKKEALLRQCFDGWVQFTADSKKAKRRLRGTFMVWKMRQMKALQHECLLEWREVVRQRKKDVAEGVEKLAKAAEDPDMSPDEIFTRWRKLIRDNKAKADEFYTAKLRAAAFDAWRATTVSKEAWRQEAAAKLYERRREANKKFAVKLLKEWREISHKAAETKKAAEAFSVETVINPETGKPEPKVDPITGEVMRKKDPITGQEMDKGTAVFNGLLVAKIFRAWRGVKSEEEEKKAVEVQKQMIRTAELFKEWRAYTDQRRLMRRCVATLQHSLEAKAFRTLRHNVRTNKVARQAIRRMQNPISAAAFTKWRQTARSNKIIRQTFFPINAPTLKDALSTWRANTKTNKRLRGHIVRMQQPLLGKALNAWKAALAEKKRWKVMVDAFETANVRRCFQAMREAATAAKTLNVMAKQRAPIFIARNALQTWRANARAQKIQKQVITRWKVAGAAPWLAEWRKQTKLLKMGRNFLRRLDMPEQKICLDQWREYVKQRKENRAQREHMFYLPARRAMQDWRSFHRMVSFCTHELILPTPASASRSRPSAIAAAMPPELWPILTRVEMTQAAVKPLAEAATGLVGRKNHAAVSVDNGGIPDANLKASVYVFGGTKGEDDLGDLVVLDCDGSVVSVQSASPQRPMPSARSVPTITHCNGSLYVHGGVSVEKDPNSKKEKTTLKVQGDMWRYDLASGAWSECAKDGTPARCMAAAVAYGPNVWIFGGYNEKMKPTNSMLRYNVDSEQWTEDVTRGNRPGGTAGAAATVVGEVMYLFGGTDGGHPVNKGSVSPNLYQFVFSTRTFIKLSLGSGPPGRQQAMMFEHEGLVYVFGGHTRNSPASDASLWYFDGRTPQSWQTKALADNASGMPGGMPGGRPLPARAGASCCRMGQGSVMLVGGLTAEGVESNDVNRLDIARDTLRLLAVGAVGRLATLWDEDVEHAIMVIMHICRNADNRLAMAKHANARLLKMLVKLARDSSSPLQSAAFEIISYFCVGEPQSYDDVLRKLFAMSQLLATAVEVWRAGVPSLKTHALIIILWTGRDSGYMDRLFGMGVGLDDISRLIVPGQRSKSKKLAEQVLKAQGLTIGGAEPEEDKEGEAEGEAEAEQTAEGEGEGEAAAADQEEEETEPLPTVRDGSIAVGEARKLGTMMEIALSDSVGPEAAQRAAEALLLLSCDSANKPKFLELFSADAYLKGLVSMISSEVPHIQRTGCSLARWLTYKNTEFGGKLVAAGVLESLTAATNSDDVGVRANVLVVMKYLARDEGGAPATDEAA